jgi:hypothetical protein
MGISPSRFCASGFCYRDVGCPVQISHSDGWDLELVVYGFRIWILFSALRFVQ